LTKVRRIPIKLKITINYPKFEKYSNFAISPLAVSFHFYENIVEKREKMRILPQVARWSVFQGTKSYENKTLDYLDETYYS